MNLDEKFVAWYCFNVVPERYRVSDIFSMRSNNADSVAKIAVSTITGKIYTLGPSGKVKLK